MPLVRIRRDPKLDQIHLVSNLVRHVLGRDDERRLGVRRVHRIRVVALPRTPVSDRNLEPHAVIYRGVVAAPILASMSAVPLPYRIAVRLAYAGAPLVERGAELLGFGDSKLARGLRGRRDAPAELSRWGRRSREEDRPTLWVHAPSVGEGLQAQAVLEALRVRQPSVRVAYTYFSPSAADFGGVVQADVTTCLPWDVPEAVGPALDGVRPDLVVFTKTEVWPTLVAAASVRRIPVALVAGVVPPKAGRSRWPARPLMRSTWNRLALACAVSEMDAVRLVRLGVPEGRVQVVGDPGIDAAISRADEADPAAPYLAPFHELPRPTVIAGSTWPEDEAVLLPALSELRRSVPGLRVIFAPHEPTPTVVADLLARLQGLGWKCRPLSAVESRGSPGDATAVVVDRVGVLAHLYSVADVAYVGGGFGTSGLHSVLEPAAAGVPVTFGPRHERAPAAAPLVASGGALIASGAEALESILAGWLQEPRKRRHASECAKAYIGSQRGAAARTAALLDPLLRPTASV